jgi:hypothetical protein
LIHRQDDRLSAVRLKSVEHLVALIDVSHRVELIPSRAVRGRGDLLERDRRTAGHGHQRARGGRALVSADFAVRM